MPEAGENMDKAELSESEQKLAGQLKKDVFALAEDIGERNMHRRGSMDLTVDWIENRAREIGYDPEKHSYEIRDGQFAGRSADNIKLEITGTANPAEIVVIGAHFDSVHGSPGANDNASAVAVLLALTEWFRERPQPQTLRFLFFANEEPPFFHTHNMGSYAYARTCRQRGEDITAMIALDGLGFFSDEADSQRYPVPGLGLLYPDTANFIGFVTRLRDRNLLQKVSKSFRSQASIASEAAALPGFIPGVYWSDHWAFWEHDYPALLVTDTLLFRDPDYHTPADTPGRLDYESMARVAEGLKQVISELAN